MADSNQYDFPELLTTFPAPFVAHVEINRPRKYNAFSPEYVGVNIYMSPYRECILLTQLQRLPQSSWSLRPFVDR